MGSKRWHLERELGSLLRRIVRPGDRFVDLFSGSGAVSWFAATELQADVLAVDLQRYSAVLAGAVIERTRVVKSDSLAHSWVAPAIDASVRHHREFLSECSAIVAGGLEPRDVLELRRICADHPDAMVRNYGGHYFSPEAAVILTELIRCLPSRPQHSKLALASLIVAASRCSASPGHTAQPFQPTERSITHIANAWSRSFSVEVTRSLQDLASRHAVTAGKAIKGDANKVATDFFGDEVVFLDPPYSAAQYSRFYHVLESIALGGYVTVSGAGRAPSLQEREFSRYSAITSAREALLDLLQILGQRGCRIVATFPQYTASNGLSGSEFADLARSWYDVDVRMLSAKFSTLGGSGLRRSARHQGYELLMTMYPR